MYMPRVLIVNKVVVHVVATADWVLTNCSIYTNCGVVAKGRQQHVDIFNGTKAMRSISPLVDLNNFRTFGRYNFTKKGPQQQLNGL